jgi:hypothetical protein
MREVQGWKDFARPLQVIFCSELPGQSDNAAYHFIAAAASIIIDEHVTFSAVASFLKKKRDVKRATRASGGNR